MASSGTVSLTLDLKLKPDEVIRSRESVMVMGRGKIKSVASIEAQDFELRTIKNFITTPYATEATPTKTKAPSVLYGSITVPGSLMNRVYMRTLKGTNNPVTGGVGTSHLGTIVGGTVQFSFVAIGA